MQPKKSAAVFLALSATVLLSALRIAVAPRIVSGEGGVLNTVLFCLLPLAVAALLVLGGRRPAAVPRQGVSLLSVGAVFTGIAMAFSAVSTFMRWRSAGIWPYPSDQTPTSLSAVFLCALALFGLLGGVFLAGQGFAWYRGKPLPASLSVLSLAPLAWTWARVCQYEVSYYSSLPVMYHWYDLAMFLVEMFFFLALARYTMHTDTPSRFLLGLSLATGLLTAVSCVTRVAMALLGEQEAWQNTGLVTSADLGVCLLAFGFAAAYTPAEEIPVPQDEPVEEPAEEPMSERPIDIGPIAVEPIVKETIVEKPVKEEPVVMEFVIEDPTQEEFSVVQEQSEEIDDEPSKPIELEDLILRLMQNPDDEQK